MDIYFKFIVVRFKRNIGLENLVFYILILNFTEL